MRLKGKILKQIKLLSILSISLLLFIAGCAQSNKNIDSEQKEKVTQVDTVKTVFPLKIKDDAGREIEIPSEPERIVSLAPSNTEILFALGLEEKVVGVTTYCDYPEEVKKKEKIGDFANPNIEKMVSLKADIIFAAGGIQVPVIEEAEKAGISIFVVDPKTIDSLLDVLIRVGKATGADAAANELVGDLKERVEKANEKVAKAEKKPTIFYELYNEPLMTAGSGGLINDVIETAGGINIAAEIKEEYPQYSLEKLIADDPEIYVGSTGSMQSAEDVAKRPGWTKLTAINNKRVIVLDENLITRPGPRLIDALEELVNEFHGE